MATTKERSGFRDQWISERHRMWGVACSATDLDFMLLEYSRAAVCGLVEYKHKFAKQGTDWNDMPRRYSTELSYKALIKLGNTCKIPVINCKYDRELPLFTVTPLNEYASKFVRERCEMTEFQWVSLLYLIRDIRMPASDLFDKEGRLRTIVF